MYDFWASAPVTGQEPLGQVVSPAQHLLCLKPMDCSRWRLTKNSCTDGSPERLLVLGVSERNECPSEPSHSAPEILPFPLPHKPGTWVTGKKATPGPNVHTGLGQCETFQRRRRPGSSSNTASTAPPVRTRGWASLSEPTHLLLQKVSSLSTVYASAPPPFSSKLIPCSGRLGMSGEFSGDGR